MATMNISLPDSMKAFVISYPPLGQVTQVREGNVSFTVVLDVHQSRGHEPWQVAMWYIFDGGECWFETGANVVLKVIWRTEARHLSNDGCYHAGLVNHWLSENRCRSRDDDELLVT